jgi:phosphoglycerate kinase
MKIKSIKQVKNLADKRVLLRVDFNVPIENKRILDDYKIKRGLLTIQFLLKNKAKIILVSHLGRPQAKRLTNERRKRYSLKPVGSHLSKLLNRKVRFIPEIEGFEAATMAGKMKVGEIILLENIRFAVGEEKNDRRLAKNLAQLADIYINDAFAVSHRKHASVAVIKNYLPAFAGLLLTEEVINLSRIFSGRKPLVAVMGGVKMVTKLSLLKKLHRRAERILVGGSLANNFLAARGFTVGRSAVDEESIKLAEKVKYKNIILPVDAVVSHRRDGSQVMVKSINRITKLDYIYDIGPETVKLYANFIRKAQTLIWNGPLGWFENEKFKHGTLAIARLIASRSRGRVFGVVGGGETVESLRLTHSAGYVDWISTGGGAMLSFLAGQPMPGLKGIIKRG